LSAFGILIDLVVAKYESGQVLREGELSVTFARKCSLSVLFLRRQRKLSLCSPTIRRIVFFGGMSVRPLAQGLRPGCVPVDKLCSWLAAAGLQSRPLRSAKALHRKQRNGSVSIMMPPAPSLGTVPIRFCYLALAKRQPNSTTACFFYEVT
jgi:hypothetical protein